MCYDFKGLNVNAIGDSLPRIDEEALEALTEVL